MKVSFRRLREERGAFAVLFSILSTVLFGMAALVVDLAAMRTDGRTDQTVADFSATAGAAYLDPNFGGSAYKACDAAWKYFKTNAPGLPADNSDPCTPFQSIVTCTVGTMPVMVEKSIGTYVADITIPAPDDAAEMEGRTNSGIDGSSCQRIAFTVKKTTKFTLARLFGAASGQTVQHAVARTGSQGNFGQGVALIVLDPTGCNALVAKGQASIIVGASGANPGIINVDSSGTNTSGPSAQQCTQSATYAIDATGTQNSSIVAQDAAGGTSKGLIIQYALQPGQGSAHAYEASDVTGGRLRPQPTAGDRVTRAPVDNLFNCKVANGCPAAGTRSPYIDNLRTAVGTSGVPSGYATYTGACSTQPSDPPIIMTGNVYVPCTNFSISNAVTFDLGDVVFNGNVTVGSSTGMLSIDASGLADHTVYFRSGGTLTKASQSSITMRRTMVYLDNGVISLGAGTGAVTWVAPTGGNFKNLAMWSESPAQHSLGGQANLAIEGIFFAPNAFPFQFSGQGSQYQTKAQFFVYRMEVTGQGTLVLAPDPERIILIPVRGVALIR